MAATIAVAVVGGLGSLPVVLDRDDSRVSIVTAADSCVYTMQSVTREDRANARTIVEGDADRMFALAIHGGVLAHTYSRAFGPNVDPGHCATALNYSVDGGTRAISFTVDLTTGEIVDVS